MTLPLAIIALVAGVALLIWGGDTLVRGAVFLANKLGVPPLLVGLTVVAFGTSAPELALNLIAAFKGNDGLSFGNIVGSNIANIGLILGITALFKPLYVSSSVVKRELPIMLIATLALLVCVGVPAGMPPLMPAPEAPPAGQISQLNGIALLVLFVLAIAFILRAGLKQRDVREKFEEEAQSIAEEPDDERTPLVAVTFWKPSNKRIPLAAAIALVLALTACVAFDIVSATDAGIAIAAFAIVGFLRLSLAPSTAGSVVSVALGVVALAIGGNFTETGATTIARSLGMTDQLIGLTVVAIATSLPELATSLQAVRRGTVDIAVGNVVGSNIFNILLVMGATATVDDVAVPADGWSSLAVMTALSLILIPMSRFRNKRITRAEGATLLTVYVAFMAWSVYATLAALPDTSTAADTDATPPGTAASTAGEAEQTTGRGTPR